MSDEDKEYNIDMLVSVEVWAENEQEARELAKSTRNWQDWNLIEINSVVEA